ncbi:MAG: hypothetical protein R3C28_06445 [Pirellulaceae bacterium]
MVDWIVFGKSSAARDELNRIRNRATAVVTTAEAMSPELAAQVADRARQMIGTDG